MALVRWSQTLGNSKEQIELKYTKLEALTSMNLVENQNQIHKVQDEINCLLLQDEFFWWQRSRVIWLPVEDKNTKYFHQRASQQRRKNHIHGFLDEHEQWCTSNADIARLAKNYFQNLSTTSNPTNSELVLDSMDKVVHPDMNHTLLQPYTPEEVRKALFSMHPSKSLGSDGMSRFFFQKFWHVVGNDVTSAVLSILHSGHFLHKMNYTHIVLIPKINEPKNVSDYRPISLGNTVSRIVSKVIANRLKLILPNVISDSQSAFVPNRLITDNTTVAFEVLHRMWNKRTGKKGQMAIKLDINKAYNRVEWSFLRKIMLKLGFDERWVQLAMATIHTATYSVLINGEPKGYISPSQGLKDSLSPYLFLLCVEGLSSLIRKAMETKQLHGILSCKNGVCISHLLFADNSFIFCQATMEEGQHLLNILGRYEVTSGQAINRHKTSIFFSRNTRDSVKAGIQALFGGRIMEDYEPYLGLPMTGGRSKVNTFKGLQEKITKKVMGWKEKFISKAGREIFIKTVAQAIPTYTMGIF